MNYTITLTKEQMTLIRQAMSNSAIKYLSRAFETEAELKELGRDDRYLVELEMAQHDACNEIIKAIDKELEA